MAGLALSGSGPLSAPDGQELALDHVPIVVHDLDRATATFRDALGFSIKPGRPHANGLRNNHIKFRDGSALELITVERPSDGLARTYRALLDAGEGAAFLSLRAGPAGGVLDVARRLGLPADTVAGPYFEWVVFSAAHPLHFLFFIHLDSPPVDEEGHLAHANTAVRLAAVWVVKSSLQAAVPLLSALGGTWCEAEASSTTGVLWGDRLELGTGSLMAVPVDAARIPDRPIVGVTLEVTDLEAARRSIARTPDAWPPVDTDARGRFVRVPPSRAHGIWLELLQPDAERDCRQ